MTRPKPQKKEAAFELHELFFSTTNKRGIIEYGNSVFVRVSGYPFEKLHKAPHSVIRHPDMPRCIFKLFWKMLMENRPIGAYVKNMASDGSYYWVYAVAFPVDNGYVSVRLKPSSPLFGTVSNLYSQLLELESSQGMEAAGEMLFSSLRSLGFLSYESFMSDALAQELLSRDQRMRQQPTTDLHLKKNSFLEQGLRLGEICKGDYRHLFESLLSILQNGNSIKACSTTILDQFTNLSFLSINMTVSAAKVGSEGKALAEISNGFKLVAEQIETQMQKFQQKIFDVIRILETSQFHMGSSRLLTEMIQAFTIETSLSSPAELDHRIADFLTNNQLLLGLCQSSTDEVSSSLTELAETLKNLLAETTGLSSIVNGLEVIRLTGKVEAARLQADHRDSFNNHLHEMTEFTEKVANQLKMVRQTGRLAAEEVEKCLKILPRTSAQIRGLSKLREQLQAQEMKSSA